MQHTLRFDQALPTVALLAAGALAALLTACGGGYGGGGGGGMGSTPCGGIYSACPPPTVTLTAPSSGATVSLAVTLTATATASAANGLTISRVDFMIDGTVVGTATASPYTVSWNSKTVANGSHSLTAKATDSMNDTATTPAITLTVQNTAAMAATMAPAQIFPAPTSGASGTANVSVELDTGAISGKVKLSGLVATAVTVNEGFAGATGAAVIALTPNAASTGEWDLPANALLSAEQVTALMQGKLYAIASSAAHPKGEIRGQLVPDNVMVTFSHMAVSQETAGLGIVASGVAATTVDTNANTLTVHVNSTGVDDAMAAQVATGAVGASAAKMAELTKDSVNMGHWSTELAAISAAEVGNFKARKWQVSVATPAEPNGAIRGQISAGQSN
ncbi:MAG TPA: CHRD domain-containing protein [Steroidobacteraceae bacterium]